MVKKQRSIEWIILTTIVLVFALSIFVDVGVLSLQCIPSWLIVTTPDPGNYQALFGGITALSASGLAIITLLTVVSDKTIYGMSLAKYLMECTHIKPLQHAWIICETIILSFVNWVFVNMNLHNSAVTIFFTEVILLLWLLKDAVRVLSSPDDLRENVATFIIKSDNATYIGNAFVALNNSITTCNIVEFEHNVAFIKSVIETQVKPTSLLNASIIESHFCLTIETANRHFHETTAAGILDLFVFMFKMANRDIDHIIELKTIENRAIYLLLVKSKLNFISLPRDAQNILLWDWQAETFINQAGFTRQGSRLTPASGLFACVGECDLPKSALQEARFDILCKAQQIYDSSTEKVKIFAEDNYFSCIVTIFNEKNVDLLHTLFGIDIEFTRNLIALADANGPARAI